MFPSFVMLALVIRHGLNNSNVDVVCPTACANRSEVLGSFLTLTQESIPIRRGALSMAKQRKLARAVQKVSGAKYTTCLFEVDRRFKEIAALRHEHGLEWKDAAVEVCFEEIADLKQRWGDIFNE